MARHNTHRAPGFAKVGVSFAPAGKTACGVALAGAAAFGTMNAAHAAPAAQPAPAAAQTQGAAPASVQIPAAPIADAAKSADISTLNFSTKLRQGSQGSYVSTLQSALNANGANLKVDGKFGWRTNNAVVNFQSANNLLVDGVVGPETKGALGGSASYSSTSSSSSNSVSTNSILSSARSQIGTPYSWASQNPGRGFDCSGFTSWVYKQNGIDISRTSGGQVAGGRVISESNARPGDIVAWPGHVGIYAGNGRVIDAGRTPASVSERNIWGNPIFVTYR